MNSPFYRRDSKSSSRCFSAAFEPWQVDFREKHSMKFRCLRGALWYVRSVCRLFHSVNIYLRRLFQYPLSTLDDDAGVCTSRARWHTFSSICRPPSIYRIPKENLNHEILRVLSLRKAEQLWRQLRIEQVCACNVYTSPYLFGVCSCVGVKRVQEGKVRGQTRGG